MIDRSSLDGRSATHNIEFLMGMDQMSITLYPTPNSKPCQLAVFYKTPTSFDAMVFQASSEDYR